MTTTTPEQSEARRLLDKADLPWWEGPTETEHSRRIYCASDGVNLATTWWDGNPHPTSKLIVHAVNTLPLYLQLQEALGEAVNALEWCDLRYRQTLQGSPVRDVTELRAYIAKVLTNSRLLLSQPSPIEEK